MNSESWSLSGVMHFWRLCGEMCASMHSIKCAEELWHLQRIFIALKSIIQTLYCNVVTVKNKTPPMV